MDINYFKMNYGIKGFKKQFGWNPVNGGGTDGLKGLTDTDPNLDLKIFLGKESFFLYCLVTRGKLDQKDQDDVISHVCALWKQLQSL